MLGELRSAQIILSLVGIIPWVVLALRYKRYWGYYLAPILFLLHIAIFNIFRIYGIPADQSVATIWSIGIRIMGIIAAGALGAGLLLDLRNNGYNGYVK